MISHLQLFLSLMLCAAFAAPLSAYSFLHRLLVSFPSIKILKPLDLQPLIIINLQKDKGSLLVYNYFILAHFLLMSQNLECFIHQSGPGLTVTMLSNINDKILMGFPLSPLPLKLHTDWWSDTCVEQYPPP